MEYHPWGCELSLYLSAIALIVAFLTALIIASWLIVCESQARRVRENFERLVLLDNQTFRKELVAFRDEITRVALTATTAEQSIASIANAVSRAIREIDSRLDKLNDRTDNLSRVNDDHHLKLSANEILQLRSTIDKLANIQKITEQRLSDEIRFNLDRASAVDASLKGFGSRIEGLSDHLNDLVRDLSGLSTSVTSLKDSLTSQANQPDTAREAQNQLGAATHSQIHGQDYVKGRNDYENLRGNGDSGRVGEPAGDYH